VTKGLQDSIHDYDQIDAELGLRRFIEPLVKRPPLGATLTKEAAADLPRSAGGPASPWRGLLSSSTRACATRPRSAGIVPYGSSTCSSEAPRVTTRSGDAPGFALSAG
jgi:hypothetical protein